MMLLVSRILYWLWFTFGFCPNYILVCKIQNGYNMNLYFPKHIMLKFLEYEKWRVSCQSLAFRGGQYLCFCWKWPCFVQSWFDLLCVLVMCAQKSILWRQSVKNSSLPWLSTVLREQKHLDFNLHFEMLFL